MKSAQKIHGFERVEMLGLGADELKLGLGADELELGLGADELELGLGTDELELKLGADELELTPEPEGTSWLFRLLERL